MKQHITVLSHEAVDALQVANDSVIVDATFGAGGHSQEILKHLDRQGVLVGIDADESAIKNAHVKNAKGATVHLKVQNFRNIHRVLDELEIQKVDGILADLGWRMDQMSGNGKGFSFRIDEPLIMTFGNPSEYPFTAADIVNDWKEVDIKNVLKGYGEERFSGRIARVICEKRLEAPILTSLELADAISEAVPAFYRKGKVHPATRSFQALRIAVNDEFDAMRDFILASVERLESNGRIVMITFHSLEDRIVKQTFKQLVADGYGTLLHKKPITPSREEVVENPRSRSAKMRTFEKNEHHT